MALAPEGVPAQEPAERGLRASPWVLSTYFAEGLPWSLVHQTSAQFFTALGASLSAIGLTSLYGLAWNLKFLWSPLVDRYGTTRRWLLATELGLGVLLVAVAWTAGQGDLAGVARLLVPVAFLAATHDIAIDGFYLKALGKRDQVAFAGLRLSAYRAALLVGNGALVVLAGRATWRLAFLVAAALLLGLTALHALSLPAPLRPDADADASAGAPIAPRGSEPGASSPPDPRPLPHFVDAFASFVRQPRGAVCIALIVLFRAGDALMFAMGAPFYKALGFDTDQRGLLGSLSTVATIAGMMGGAALVSRLKLARTLVPITAVQSAAILIYPALAAAHPSRAIVTLAVIVEQLVSGLGMAAFSVFLMRRCQGKHQASHFAMATALMSVGATVAGSVSGYLAEQVGFTLFFALAFAASLPGVLLSRAVPVD